MAIEVTPPFKEFTDLSGAPLDNGYIYIGTENLNPEVNLISIYWDESFTTPAANPVRTISGYLSRNGSPARIFTKSAFSITVKDKNSQLVYSSLSSNNIVQSTTVGTIAALRTTVYSGQSFVSVTGYYTAADNIGVREYYWDDASVEADNGGTIIQVTGVTTGRWKLKYSGSIDVKWFGTKGDGISDDTSEIQNAVNALTGTGTYADIKNGTYNVTSRITIPTGTGLIGDKSATIFAKNSGFNNTSPTTHYTSNSIVISLSGETVTPYTACTNQKLIGVKIQYETLDGTVVDAVEARNCNNLEIRDNEIFGFTMSAGIAIASLGDNCKIVNNKVHTFYNNSTFGLGYGDRGLINLYGIILDDDRVNDIMSTYVIIEGNWVENIKHSAAVIAVFGDQADGIGVQNGYSCRVSNNTVIDVNEGIDCYALYTKITNNVFVNNGGWGIKLIHGARYNDIIGNYVKDAGLGGIVIAGGTPTRGDTSYNNFISNFVENVDPTGVNSLTTSTSCINIDNQLLGANASNNIFIGNRLDPGTYGKYQILNQAPTLNVNNVFSDTMFLGTPTLGRSSGLDPYTVKFDQSLPTALKAYQSLAQTVATATWTKLNIDVSQYDTNNDFDETTDRFIAKDPGRYNVNAACRLTTGAAGFLIAIRKNGTAVAIRDASGASLQSNSISYSVECSLGDYLEVFIYQASGVDKIVTEGNAYTYMQVDAI